LQTEFTKSPWVFELVKDVFGFRSLFLRGRERVGLEWKMVTTNYNLKRLFKLGTPLRSA
jgi:hypothetical protein